MAKIDRDAQRRILEALRESYPQHKDSRGLEVGLDQIDVGANLSYLEENGLVKVKWSGNRLVGVATITAQGIDFLADDGGLSAILGAVTVKLHEDTLKALLEKEIENSAAPETVKSKLKEQIRALPSEALKTIISELLKVALKSGPDALHLLQTLFSH
jgi:predicted ArsR family transcriptional regulator